MNGDTDQTSGPSARDHKSKDQAFLPIGIVFAILAVAMGILANPAWIAFGTMGATFLVLCLRGRAKKHPTEAPED
ncbi:hypothetical protein [Paenarthrobacter sp. NPDC058040]|uniref:hypothetical protein n=1 Tax=unclassified Paenarthrobacter TaxID=2634190 RepID=UPI0036D8BA92